MNHRSIRDGSPIEIKTLLVVPALALGVVLRLLFLNSDPKNDVWPGYVIDEGLWTELARELVLFGSVDFDGLSRLQLLIAPAYQVFTTVSFALLGVGFSSARLVSAISGIALLLGVVGFMRNRFSSEGLFVTSAALALQPDLLFLSRVAIPESAAMLFEFLAFAVLVSDPDSSRRAFAAGLVTTLALAMKATVAPIVVILAVTALFGRGFGDWRGLGRRRLTAYLGGLALPGVVVLVTGAVAWQNRPEIGLASLLGSVASFVHVNSAYAAVGTLFHSTFAPELFAFLIPVLVIAGVLFSAREIPTRPATIVYLGSAMWIIGWLVVASVAVYFPERYVHHVFVPLALNVGAGLTLIRDLGTTETRAASGMRRLLASGCLALPFAVITSPIALALVGVSGFAVESLTSRLGMISLLLLVLTVAQSSRRHAKPVRLALIVAPLVFAPLWFMGVHLGLLSGGFWAHGTSDVIGKSVLLATAVLVILIYHGTGANGWSDRKYRLSYLVIFSGLWLAQISPWFLTPTYTISEASSALDALVEESTLVMAATVGSVFLGTRLRYTEDLRRMPPPDVLVVAMFPERLAPTLLDAYHLVETFDLRFDECPTCLPFDHTVQVFRRNP